jgi:hypothetical protein
MILQWPWLSSQGDKRMLLPEPSKDLRDIPAIWADEWEAGNRRWVSLRDRILEQDKKEKVPNEIHGSGIQST